MVIFTTVSRLIRRFPNPTNIFVYNTPVAEKTDSEKSKRGFIDREAVNAFVGKTTFFGRFSAKYRPRR